jgi:hypothetical protein
LEGPSLQVFFLFDATGLSVILDFESIIMQANFSCTHTHIKFYGDHNKADVAKCSKMHVTILIEAEFVSITGQYFLTLQYFNSIHQTDQTLIVAVVIYVI